MSQKKQYIIGIDEAGRGPVIGPMVICAYAIEKEKELEIKKLGVKDSKRLSKKRREELYTKLMKLAADTKVKKVSPAEIDELRKSYSLNVIEQKIMLNLAKKISVKPIEIYIDAADVKEKRFGSVFENEFPQTRIVSKHKADEIYPVVSAASIIAKVQRDKEIQKISKETGIDFGSGYPADPKTIKFLRDLFRKQNKFPPYVRESWDTAKKIKKEFSNSKKLTDFVGSS
jgi:ribonuclease HII